MLRPAPLATVVVATLLWAMTPQGISGTLSGSFSEVPGSSTVTLTTEGPADWIHWGLSGARDVNRKAGVGPQISDFTVITGQEVTYLDTFQFTDNPNGYAWTDGSPVPSVVVTTTGVYVFASYEPVNTGFEITAPADARMRTLKIYLGAFSGDGTLVASLSDGSAAPYESTFGYNQTGPSRVYTFDYAANSTGQTLRLQWILTKRRGSLANTPNVNLQAATLATPGISVLPWVSITSPSHHSQFLINQSIPLEADASDIDGTVSNVAFFADNNLIGEVANSPFSLDWTDASAGFHMLTAVATDDAGEQTASAEVEVFVHHGESVLAGNQNLLPSGAGATPVDLSAEGALDWIHWGLLDSDSVDRLTAVPPLITPFAHFGTNPVQRLTDSHASWSWTNGMPTVQNPYSTTGVFAEGRTNGFELQFDASPQGRLARIYIGLYGARGAVKAYLTNASGPAYLADSISNTFSTSDAVCEVSFASARPGDSLIVRVETEEQLDLLYGNLRLLSATLQSDDTVFLPLRLLAPRWTGNAFSFSLLTQPNHTYSVERAPALPAVIWDVTTNFPGTGEVTTITNVNPPGGGAYYRVIAQ